MCLICTAIISEKRYDSCMLSDWHTGGIIFFLNTRYWFW